MPKVLVLHEDVDFNNLFELPLGASLMNAFEENDAGIEFGCRAAGCGVCHIQLVEGFGNLNPISLEEHNFLKALNAGETDRLCCQVKVHGDIVVRIVE